jgi:hypothetical protein
LDALNYGASQVLARERWTLTSTLILAGDVRFRTAPFIVPASGNKAIPE